MGFRNVSGPVELLGRAVEEAGESRLLIALPPETGMPFSEIAPDARYVHLDYAVYRKDRELLRRASGLGEELVFFGTRELPGLFPVALLFAPKEKELCEYMLGWLWERTEPGGRVWVAGENRAGIKSVKGMLEERFGPVIGHRSGRHSVLWEAERSGDMSPLPSFRREFEAQVEAVKLRVVSYPGVFSHGELDPGTRYLLETLDRPQFRRVLDWGCGSGAIGTYLQLLRPESSVDLVDSHAMAVQSAEETMTLNGLAPGRVGASDGFSDVRGTFDLIVSNPPFHAGIRTEMSVSERMIRESGRFLLPGGRLVLVANAFLKYLDPLRESFRDVRVLAENPSYRVFEATNG